MTNKLSKVKERFATEGISIAEWARANGFKRHLVYRVIDGRCKATRGKAHRIAVALGLKSEPKKLILRPMTDAA